MGLSFPGGCISQPAEFERRLSAIRSDLQDRQTASIVKLAHHA